MSEPFSWLFLHNAKMASTSATVTSIVKKKEGREGQKEGGGVGGQRRHLYQLASTNVSLARAVLHSHQ